MVRQSIKAIVLTCLVCFDLIIISGCSAHTNLEPIEINAIKVNASLGGPIVTAFDMKFPLPYLTIGARYGLSSNSLLNANLHLTSLPYQIIGIETGFTYFPVINRNFIPTIGINPQFLTMMSIKSGVGDRIRIYPTISSTFVWHLGENLIFTGFDLTIPFTKTDFNEESPRTIFSPVIGYKFELGKNLSLITEIKWQGANIRTDQLAAEYVKLSGKGAFGILISFEKGF